MTSASTYPIVKFGGRWVCDGPDGRFHASTKTEAQRLLVEALDKTFTCPECGTEMVLSPINPGFLIHVESTDCAPDPWPTVEAIK